MDRLASMAAFVKAADAGSFAMAATALGVSPQMVAKHVVFLEERLGTRLLNRTTRRQSLTEVGRHYYERCKLVLAEAEAADLLVHEARGVPRGLLRVNAPVTFGTQRLAAMVSRYLRSHPDVEVDLILNDRYVDLIEEGYEIAFRIGPLADSGLITRALAPYRTVTCASPAYLEERGSPASPDCLREHECLLRPGMTEWRFTHDMQEHTARVKGRLRLNDAKAQVLAALDGFGIAFVTEDLVRTHLAAGELVRVLPTYETPSLPMHLVFLPDRRQTPKLRSFIDAAVDAFAG